MADPSAPPDGDRVAELGYLRTVGLVVTYHCQLACAHCIVEASPRRTERLDLDRAAAWLDGLASYRGGHVRAVALTGGEPFSDLAHLRRLAQLVGERGLVATAVTNAFWATSPTAAEQVLESLPELGILTFSTDVFHLRAIPLDRVENAARAARRLARRFVVAVCTRGRGDDETAALLGRISAFTPPEDVNVARIFPVGRARALAPALRFETSPEPPPYACTMAHAPVFLPDGRVVACFGPVVALPSGHPLQLGDASTELVGDILDRAERNAVLHAIRLWGPGELVRRLRQAGPECALPLLYVTDSACCACHSLLADPARAGALARLGQDPGFQREVAFGRVHYLGEPQMVEALGLPVAPAAGVAG